MKHLRTFGLCLLYLASFLAPQACLNNPESTVETQEFPLEIAGRTEDPSGAPLAEVMVYVEQESAPEGVSDAPRPQSSMERSLHPGFPGDKIPP